VIERKIDNSPYDQKAGEGKAYSGEGELIKEKQDTPY
jgi:hypothetical protein